MENISVEEFMARLDELDENMSERVESAKAKGCHLR